MWKTIDQLKYGDYLAAILSSGVYVSGLFECADQDQGTLTIHCDEEGTYVILDTAAIHGLEYK